MNNILVGFFNVPGAGTGASESVSTPLTGNGNADYAQLNKLIRKRFPKSKYPAPITRVGSAIESATAATATVEYSAGAILKSLFGGGESGKEECSTQIGSVTFNDQPCDVVLRYHRARDVAGITLKERATKVPIHFSDQVSAQQLVSEMSTIVREILGDEAKDLRLTLTEIST